MLGDIYSEFVESFDTSSKINRTWVKGGTVNQDTNKPPLKVNMIFNYLIYHM